MRPTIIIIRSSKYRVLVRLISSSLPRWSKGHNQNNATLTTFPTALPSPLPPDISPFNSSDSDLYDDVTIANALKNRVRILVWVMTQNLGRATQVKKTWAKRAEKVVYVSSQNNTAFPAVGFAPLKDDKQHAMEKTHRSFRYIYEQHFEEADWFMKSNDDTYVIVENLRYFLADKDPNDAVCLGQKITNGSNVFLKGGAGLVFSKEALRLLATKGRDPKLCRQEGVQDDVDMAKCLTSLGVRLEDTADKDGRDTFCGFYPDNVMTRQPARPPWYMDSHGNATGAERISHFPITFHKIESKMMHTLDFLLYYARPYGIKFGHTDYNNQ